MGGFRDLPLMNITHQKWQDVTSAMYDGTLWHLPRSNSFSGSSHLFALKAKAAMLSQGKAHMAKNWGQPLIAVLHDSTYNRYQPTASKELRTSVQPPTGAESGQSSSVRWETDPSPGEPRGDYSRPDCSLWLTLEQSSQWVAPQILTHRHRETNRYCFKTQVFGYLLCSNR